MDNSRLSFVVPCLNEEGSVEDLFHLLTESIKEIENIECEVIFIDDGSIDKTLNIIKTLAEKYSSVKYISFSRNFGKEPAMYAGMSAAAGDYVCVIDADLQDSPALLPQMYRGITEQGYDCVAVRRVTREGEPKIRSAFARFFYKIMSRLCSIEVVDGARDFRMMTRQMCDAVLSLQETNRYSKGIFAWVGFNTLWLESVNHARVKGESKWSFWSLAQYAVDAMISFSTKPLAVSSIMGILLCVLSFLGIIFTIVRQLIWGGSAYGWSSLVCIILLLSGIQLFCFGILGQYLAKIFSETKKRPLYIIKEASVDDSKK